MTPSATPRPWHGITRGFGERAGHDAAGTPAASDNVALAEALADALKRFDHELDAQQGAAEDRLLPPLLAEYLGKGKAR